MCASCAQRPGRRMSQTLARALSCLFKIKPADVPLRDLRATARFSRQAVVDVDLNPTSQLCVPQRLNAFDSLLVQQFAIWPGTRETARSEIAPRNHRQTGRLRGRAGSPSTPLRSRVGHLANCCVAIAPQGRHSRSRLALPEIFNRGVECQGFAECSSATIVRLA